MEEKHNRFEQNSARATFVLVLISLLLALLASEFIFRMVKEMNWQKNKAQWQHELYRVLDDDRLEFALLPGVTRENKIPDTGVTWSYRINSHGFRGAEFDPGHPGKHILFIGDSYTFGWAVDEEETLTAAVERQLAAPPYAMDIHAYNLGVPGYNTYQELAQLEQVLQRYKADMVVLGYVVNDAKQQRNVPVRPSTYYRHVSSWLLAEVLQLINRDVFDGRPVLDSGLLNPRVDTRESFERFDRGWVESRAAFGGIAALCREQGVPLLVIMHPAYAQHLDARYPYVDLHASVVQWAAEEGVTIVDILDYMHGRDRNEYQVIGDGHPNGKSFEVTAQFIAPLIHEQFSGTSE
ncbi:MAG: SGNH/GDSL hydrolase family protein [Halioglobus sp.]|nr:SGNH/GDSL hydrolase family protein [Halioglobus sp.]